MNIIEVDVEKTKLFSIGQQYNNNALAIHFVNLPNQKNKYIYYKIDDIEKEIPLVSDLFIVSRPLTLHSGEVKAQIIVRDETNETIELTKNFTMRIQPSNYSGIGEDDNYPDDPNIKNYFVKIDEKVNSFEELANLVQSKLDNGDFVGEQGPKGEKGDPGEKGAPGDVTKEYINLANQIAQNATNAQTSATNAQTSATNAHKILDDTKTFANQAKTELNLIKTDTNILKDEANTSALNAKASENKAKEYADNLQASTDDISQLKEDLVNAYKYKDDHPQYHFEQGTIRTGDGYINKGSKKGIYTPALIYLTKGTNITFPSSYAVNYYLWDNDTYIGMHESNIVAESGFYRICIRHIDGTDMDVNEGSNLILDEKPRIIKLENDVLDLDGNVDDLSLELNQLQSFFVNGKNIIDTRRCIAYGTGSVNANNGTIDATGGSLYIYGFYDLEVGNDYVISKDISHLYVYFYNADGSYGGASENIAVGGAVTYKTFNAKYPKCIIISAKDALTQQIQLELGTVPTSYIPFFFKLNNSLKIADKTLYEKKVLIIGDSISTGDSSLKLYADEKYGGYNKWVDALIDEGFFNEFLTRNDSIHATGYVAKVSTFGDCDYVSRLKAIQNPNEYDYVFVTGCYNDWRHDVPLDTFKTAVNTFYDYLVNNFTQAKILVSNSLKSFRCDYANNNGNYQNEYNDYIKEVARKYSLPFFDLYYDSGFCPEVLVYRNMWTYYSVAEGETEGVNDGVHPNERWCRDFMARMIKHFIEQYI